MVVMHCFSGDAGFAQACVERGFLLSFAGTVTFKNAQALRDALAVTPLDHVLVETDAPFLTPAPFRGRPNASYLIPHTIRAMAERARAGRGRGRHRGVGQLRPHLRPLVAPALTPGRGFVHPFGLVVGRPAASTPW